MTRMQLTVALWAAVALAGLGAGALYLQGEEPATAALGAPFELVDTEGNPVTEALFEGQPTALFFGFTHCPEVCPTTVYELTGWMEELGEPDLQTVFVTVDPERDTPEILHDYLRAQSDDIVGISGEPEAVWEMARSWRVYWNADAPDENGNYNVDHTSFVYLLDDEGDYAGMISYGETSETALPKLRNLVQGRPVGS